MDAACLCAPMLLQVFVQIAFALAPFDLGRYGLPLLVLDRVHILLVMALLSTVRSSSSLSPLDLRYLHFFGVWHVCVFGSLLLVLRVPNSNWWLRTMKRWARVRCYSASLGRVLIRLPSCLFMQSCSHLDKALHAWTSASYELVCVVLGRPHWHLITPI